MVKRCWVCKVEKAASEFYRNRAKSDGLATECKECMRARVSEYKRRRFSEDRERENAKARAYVRKKRETDPEWTARQNARANEWSQKNHYYERCDRQKIWARTTFNRAVQKGKVKRQPCEECGVPDAHGHHEDYSKPLEVRWLCPRCHAELHRSLR